MGRSAEQLTRRVIRAFNDGVENVLDDRAPARPPVASFTLVEEPAPPADLATRLLGAPGWGFHVGTGLAALSFLWAASGPSAGTVPSGMFTWLAVAVVTVWAIRLMIAAARGSLALSYVVVPVVALALGGLVLLDTPQQARWFQAKDGFEETLRALPSAKKWDQATVDAMTPGRIGSYRLDGVTRDSAGHVHFHLDGSAASFIYLVDGVTAETTAANPAAEFEHVSGNWYVTRPTH